MNTPAEHRYFADRVYDKALVDTGSAVLHSMRPVIIGMHYQCWEAVSCGRSVGSDGSTVALPPARPPPCLLHGNSCEEVPEYDRVS